MGMRWRERRREIQRIPPSGADVVDPDDEDDLFDGLAKHTHAVQGDLKVRSAQKCKCVLKMTVDVMVDFCHTPYDMVGELCCPWD